MAWRNSLPEEVEIHGRATSTHWLVNYLLQWFGPFETRVKTGKKCAVRGCKGELTHVYATSEIHGKPYKHVFTYTNEGRRVQTWCRDSCTVPSCENWGEFVAYELDYHEEQAKAYRKQTRTWKFNKKKQGGRR